MESCHKTRETASRERCMPPALSLDGTQAIGALSQGSYCSINWYDLETNKLSSVQTICCSDKTIENQAVDLWYLARSTSIDISAFKGVGELTASVEVFFFKLWRLKYPTQNGWKSWFQSRTINRKRGFMRRDWKLLIKQLAFVAYLITFTDLGEAQIMCLAKWGRRAIQLF